jgi:hypothetical protein
MGAFLATATCAGPNKSGALMLWMWCVFVMVYSLVCIQWSPKLPTPTESGDVKASAAGGSVESGFDMWLVLHRCKAPPALTPEEEAAAAAAQAAAAAAAANPSKRSKAGGEAKSTKAAAAAVGSDATAAAAGAASQPAAAAASDASSTKKAGTARRGDSKAAATTAAETSGNGVAASEAVVNALSAPDQFVFGCLTVPRATILALCGLAAGLKSRIQQYPQKDKDITALDRTQFTQLLTAVRHALAPASAMSPTTTTGGSGAYEPPCSLQTAALLERVFDNSHGGGVCIASPTLAAFLSSFLLYLL